MKTIQQPWRRVPRSQFHVSVILAVVILAMGGVACGESSSAEAESVSPVPNAAAAETSPAGDINDAPSVAAADPDSGDRMARLVPEGSEENFPREFHGYRLLDPAPEGSEEVEKGPLRAGMVFKKIVDRNPTKVLNVYSYQGRISRIEYTEFDAQPVEPYFEEAKKRFGEADVDYSSMIYIGSGLGVKEGDTGVGIRRDGKTAVTSLLEDMNLSITSMNAAD